MGIVKLLWNVMRLLVNSCLFISIAAMLCALQTYLVEGKITHVTPLAALIFFATLFVYNWHRLLSNRIRLKYAGPGMHQWIAAHHWWSYTAIAVSVIGIAVCFWHLSIRVQVALFVLGLISVAYALPIPLGKHLRLRLRDLGLFKPFVLGIVWGVATAMLPLLDMGFSITSNEMLFIVAKRVLFISAICIPFDIKDMEFDRHTMRYPTIPLRVGEQGARYIALGVLALFEVLVAIHNGFSPVGIALTTSFLVTAAVILYPNPRRSEYYYTFGIDGTIILQGLLVWAAVAWGGKW